MKDQNHICLSDIKGITHYQSFLPNSQTSKFWNFHGVPSVDKHRTFEQTIGINDNASTHSTHASEKYR